MEPVATAAPLHPADLAAARPSSAPPSARLAVGSGGRPPSGWHRGADPLSSLHRVVRIHLTTLQEPAEAVMKNGSQQSSGAMLGRPYVERFPHSERYRRTAIE
jgi:hypothetical protein